MGSDIHWVLERRHPDTGDWHAVLSETTVSIEQQRKQGYSWDFEDPGVAFRMRSYQWFDILSSVRGEDESGPCLADEGLPDDASDYTKDALDWNERHQAFPDIYSQGWVPLTTLHAARDGTLSHEKIKTDEDREIVCYFVDLLDTLIAREGEDGPTTILTGRRYDPKTDEYHPDMTAMSNHEHLAKAEREKTFGAVRPADFRLMVGYDN